MTTALRCRASFLTICLEKWQMLKRWIETISARRNVTVETDFRIMIGGPAEAMKRELVVFKAGEKCTLRRVSADRDYPDMYEIIERPEVGYISRGIVCGFPFSVRNGVS